MPHLCLALLAVDDLGWDDLGGSGLGSRANAFGLGDDHLGNGSGGGDDCWFGALNGLQALFTLPHSSTGYKVSYISDYKHEITGYINTNITLYT